MAPFAVQAQDLSRLQTLLSTTPQGGWVKASTGNFSSAWPVGSTSVGSTYPTLYGPGAIVYAWSSFAWDSNRGEMMLWGGGHANYAGNEMYTWRADTGAWARDSLPSRAVGNYIIDNAAPQSAHTYDGNVFVPNNDLFINFLGPTYNTGDRSKILVNGVAVNAGPWMFDPRLADGNKVGGTTGSGYDSSSLGANMWINRQGQWTGTEGPYAPYVATAYRSELGKDVVYLSMDQGSSHFPKLVRYTLGDVRNGGLDKWETIGVTTNSIVRGGTATLDTAHNLFVRAAFADNLGDLTVWNLANANATNPNLNPDIAVHLVKTNGTAFVMNENLAIEYDQANDQFILWDGSAQGKVWSTRATYLGNGQLASTWVITELASTTILQPSGNFQTGVYGKFKYIPELGAFMALNEFNTATLDAEVWLYKPFATAVPEASTVTMMLMGLGLVAWRLRRRKV